MRRLFSRIVCKLLGHAAPVVRVRDVLLPAGALKLTVTRCARCNTPVETRAYGGCSYPLRRA
jgi:hypothetical protein